MEVILQQEVPSLGKEGDQVKVASGYANNYLLPRGLAVLATPGNLKQFELKRASLAKKEEAAKVEAEKLAKKIDGKQVKLEAKAGEEGKLYGSVTSKDIVESVASQLKIDLDKKQVDLPVHIKEVGSYQVKVKFHSEVEATLAVDIVATGHKPTE